MIITPTAPIVALDVDGVLADYHGHLHWFAELYLQRKVPLDWGTANGEFDKAMHLTKEEYRQIKLCYVHSGLRRAMPLKDSLASSLCREVRRSGCQLWLCASKPWKQTLPVDHDLMFWLDLHRIEADAILFGDNKYEQLVTAAQAPIICAVDDLPEQVERAIGLDIPTALRDGDHNKWWGAWSSDRCVAPVVDMFSVHRYVFGRIEDHNND